jgi:hypothetical protein
VAGLNPPILRTGTTLNVVPRLSIAYFLGEVLLHPDDPRFAGKAIPFQDLVVVSGLSLVCRALRCAAQALGALPSVVRRLEPADFLAGNDGQLVQPVRRYYYVDHLPHFHGTGAVRVVLQTAFGMPALSAMGVANGLHLLLELRGTTRTSCSEHTTCAASATSSTISWLA